MFTNGPIGETLIGSMVVGRSERPFTDTAERDEYRRQLRLASARRSAWEEFERADVVFGRRWIEHRPSGRRFKVVTGLIDAAHSPVVAYLVTEDGRDVIALEELRP